MLRICPVFLMFGLLAACGDPLSDVPRLSQIQEADAAPRADIMATGDQSLGTDYTAAASQQAAPQRGLLGFLRKKADATLAAPSEGVTPKAGQSERPQMQAAIGTIPEDAAPKTAQGRTDAELVPAALARPEPDNPPEPEPAAAPRRGLFSGVKSANRVKSGAPDYKQVGPGERLPYGQLARLCGVSPGKLGRAVETYPEQGRGYTIYDSNPKAAGPRNFYVAGFDDGCLRQFTAALAVFGAPEIYEQIRYGAPGKHLPKSATDQAYDQVKFKICKVTASNPCGTRMKKLSRDTVFLSVYERLDSNPRWQTILLHRGEVAAMDLK